MSTASWNRRSTRPGGAAASAERPSGAASRAARVARSSARGSAYGRDLARRHRVARSITPVLVQQIFDHGFDGGFRPTYVYTLCAAALALVVITYLAGRLAARRLVKASEQALMALRVRTFEHIHQLSIAEQTEEKRGVFVARVTADVDTLSQFTEWGGIAWIISIARSSAGWRSCSCTRGNSRCRRAAGDPAPAGRVIAAEAS